ncbi:hypothetical protein BsWGS_19497 [Bradybaena similaris]
MTSHKRYWIDLGCFSFVFIILLSMVSILLLACVPLIDELLENWGENYKLAIIFVAWWLILEAARFVVRSGAVEFILPP